MAVYCAIDDIKAEFKTLSFATSTDEGITEEEVEGFIDQASAMIDTQISNCYILPIDENIVENETLLSSLKNACIWLVADRLIPILQIKSRNQNLDQNGQKEITYYMKAKSLLNKICPSKENGLDSPAKKESSTEVDAYTNQDAFFQRDTTQW
jgi:phage gp36-like protein